MGKIYLPYAEQFDLMNENLAKIANAIGSDIDISTWAGIQKAVRVGVAPDLIPVGTQLSVHHSVYGDMLLDVVAHNHFKSAHDENAYTMTLMCHDVITKLQYDNHEAFYYADVALPAGTYHFTIPTSFEMWEAGTYQFTLTKQLPKGGQLSIGNGAGMALLNTEVYAHVSSTSDTLTESGAPISLGEEGTNLGTFGIELNHTHRAGKGSNNYKESAIRQFLNSTAAAGSVWTPQTKFDRPPYWVKTAAGFAGGLDDEFLAIVGEVIVPCSANNTYESPDSTTAAGEKYVLKDKFYIASQKEIFGTTSDTVADDSTLFPYYKGATNTDRIKYADGAATHWWLRSPYSWNANYTKIIRSSGALDHYDSNSAYGIIPICTIV